MRNKRDISKIRKVFIFRGMVDVVCDEEKIRSACRLPYGRNKNGCPNYGKRKDCPPNADFFSDIYGSKVVIVGVMLDFEAYLQMRREKHPNWSELSIRNSRYWQGHLKSALRKYIEGLFLPSADEIIWNPEAMGVDLTKTCRKVGIELEWPPQKRVYRIALIARKK